MSLSDEVQSLAQLTELLPGAWQDSPCLAGGICLRLTPRFGLRIADPVRWKTGPCSWGKIRLWDEINHRDLHTTPTLLTVSNILNVAAMHIARAIVCGDSVDMSTLPKWLAPNVIDHLGQIQRIAEAAANDLREATQ